MDSFDDPFYDFMISFEKIIETTPDDSMRYDDRYIYRALRRDELQNFFILGMLIPPCSSCFSFSNTEECCKKTIQQHINSGSRTKEKSKFISCTKKQKIAALWSAVKKDKSGMVARTINEKNPSLPSGVIAKIDTHKLQKESIIDPLGKDSNDNDYLTGDTARNNAKASAEILINGNIPGNAVELFISEEVTTPVYKEFPITPDGKKIKFEGKPKSSSSKKYVIVYKWDSSLHPPIQMLPQMSKIAKRGIESRFITGYSNDDELSSRYTKKFKAEGLYKKLKKPKKQRTKNKTKRKKRKRSKTKHIKKKQNKTKHKKRKHKK